MSERLALRGGTPVRSEALPRWPPAPSEEALQELEELLTAPAVPGKPRAPWQMEQKRRFEEAFAAYCGTCHAIGVSSGTSALDLVVEALDLPADGVVVAANYGHPSTVQRAATRHRLRLLDVDPHTLCLAPAEVEEALGRGDVCCVLTTHFAGQPAGARALAELCATAGVPLVEDAAHAHGALAEGRRAGSFGLAGCFSLHGTKNLAGGEGGAVTTSDPELQRKIWRLHDIGRDPGSAPYDFVARGGNHRLSEPCALLARHHLLRLEAENRRRCDAAERLRRELGDDGPLRLQAPGGEVERHVYHLVPARYQPEACGGLSRKRFLLALAAEGIAAQAGWPSVLSRLEPFVAVAEPYETPVAEAACRESLWLDQRLLLVDDGVEQILEAVDKVRRLAGTVGGRRR